MTEINTFVFFDLETTGLPHQERNRTKIIELSMIAASRKDINDTEYGLVPPVSKLTLVFNPQKRINPFVVKLTGLSNKLLKHAPVFSQKAHSLVSFLCELPKPVCLVAHNGNIFDFKIFLAECNDAEIKLPSDLLCVDSLQGFRKLSKTQPLKKPIETLPADIMTDDEDEWDSLYEPVERDDMWSHVLDSEEEAELIQSMKNKQRSIAISNTFNKKAKATMNKDSFKLTDIYRRLLDSEPVNAHRAEDDCLMLLKCVVVLKEFIPWADGACKYLQEVKPLQRYLGPFALS